MNRCLRMGEILLTAILSSQICREARHGLLEKTIIYPSSFTRGAGSKHTSFTTALTIELKKIREEENPDNNSAPIANNLLLKNRFIDRIVENSKPRKTIIIVDRERESGKPRRLNVNLHHLITLREVLEADFEKPLEEVEYYG